MTHLLGSVAALDLFLFRAINRDGGPALDGLARLLSWDGFGVCVGLLALAWILWTRWPRVLREPLAFAATLLVSDLVGDRVLRPLFGRVRPCYALPAGTFRWLAPAANAGSLPSLHAANLFGLALVGTLACRRLAVPLYAAAVAVSLSRVYVGVHWPTDALAGAAWGTLAGTMGWAASGRVARARAGAGGAGGPAAPS